MHLTLESRLRRLRGAPEPDQPSADASSNEPAHTLAKRLERLGPDRAKQRRERVPDELALAEALGADRLAPGVLLVERRLSARQRHGRGPLGHPGQTSHLPLPPGWCTDISTPQIHLDTETSGLAGGTGTWAFLTGLLRWDADGWRLRQYLLCRLDAEPTYLSAIAADLAPPTALVTYNGRSFDAPLLSTRFRLAGLSDPVAPLPHLDLLAPMRRAFARRWPDCRLITAESKLLGLQRQGDLPGAAAPTAWLGWLRHGEISPLAAVLRHNRDDLCSLAGLIPVLDRVYLDPAGLGADPRAVAASHTARGHPALALEILMRGRHLLERNGLLDLARLHRRLGHWPEAIEIWERMESAGDAEARAALARYHEHRSGNLQHALALAERLPPGEDRDRRRTRLAAKLHRADRNPSLPAL